MRYVIEWTIRTGGHTHDQMFEKLETLQTAFGKWKPERA